MNVCFLVYFLTTMCSLWGGETDLLSHLSHYGDGLNIEGGLIAKDQKKEHQVWANIGFILDRPLIEKRDLDEITKENTYLLKESSLLEYNEPQVAMIQALVIKYYIENGHLITNKNRDEPVRMVINVHRNRSGPAHIELLERLFQVCFTDLKKIDYRKYATKKMVITLSYGTLVDFSDEFEDADIILSLSLFSGLNQAWSAGTALLPETFIPFDLHSMHLLFSDSSPSQNHLLEVIEKVLALQTALLITQVNEEFFSPNRKKRMLKAHWIQKEEIKEATILQANGMFYPKHMRNTFEVN